MQWINHKIVRNQCEHTYYFLSQIRDVLYMNYLGKSMEMFSVLKVFSQFFSLTCVINNLDIDHQCSWIHVCLSHVFHHLNYCHQQRPCPHQFLVDLPSHQTCILKTHPKDQRTNSNAYLRGAVVYYVSTFLDIFWTLLGIFGLFPIGHVVTFLDLFVCFFVCNRGDTY